MALVAGGGLLDKYLTKLVKVFCAKIYRKRSQKFTYKSAKKTCWRALCVLCNPQRGPLGLSEAVCDEGPVNDT